MAKNRRYEATEMDTDPVSAWDSRIAGIGLQVTSDLHVTQVTVKYTSGLSAAELAAQYQDSARIAEALNGDSGMQGIPGNLIESVTLREVHTIRLMRGIR